MNPLPHLPASTSPTQSVSDEYHHDTEKHALSFSPGLKVETLEQIAAAGHVATDAMGNPIVHFDPVAEARLRRKIDLMIVPTVSILYLFCFIDRVNSESKCAIDGAHVKLTLEDTIQVGNARLAGLEATLGLKGYDYNTLLSIFYVSYIAFEIPSSIANKLIGPGKWLPFITFCFGLLSICTAFVRNFGSGLAVRFLLGVFECGMLPGIAFYLSRWYRKDELGFRLSLFIVMSPMAGAFGGLLASGILSLDSIGSVKRWEMIFLVEGIITCGLAVIGFFTLTDRVEMAKWLTPEEKALAIARVKSENVAQKEVIDSFKRRALWEGITAPTTLALALMFLFDNITVQGVSFFTPTIVKTIFPHLTTVQLQLRTVPPYVVGACGVLFFPWLSDRIHNRAFVIAFLSLVMMVGYVLYLATTNPHARYAGSFIIMLSAFPMGALMPAWASSNLVSDTARAGAIGTVVLGGNIGGLIATWSYLPNAAPNYVPGNALNVGTSIGIFFLSISLYFYLRHQNSKRDALRDSGLQERELEGKSAVEMERLGHRHPGFRYRL